MGTKLNLNGVELDFDALDADFVERFAPAEQEFLKTCSQEVSADDAVLMREQVKAGYALLDTAWGEGTANRVFGGKQSLSLIMDAYIAMDSLARQQVAAFEEKMKVFTARYESVN